MRPLLFAVLAAAALFVPGAASAKYVNLSCSDGNPSSVLVRVDTDRKTIAIASSAEQTWYFLFNAEISDSAFRGVGKEAGGGSRQFAIDRASGAFSVVMSDGRQSSANCTVTTLSNKF